MKYELILFDLDDTLLDFEKSETEAFIKTFNFYKLKYNETHLEEYKKHNKAVWSLFEKGEIQMEKLKTERFKRFLNAVNIALPPDEFSSSYLKYLSEEVHFIENAEEVFKSICAEYRVSFITNGISIVQNNRIRKAGFFDNIEHLIISEEVGSQKPAPEIFEITLKKHGLGRSDKAKVLMIGDNLYSDIKGGLDFGLDACWFNYKNIVNDSDQKPTYTIKNLKELTSILL